MMRIIRERESEWYSKKVIRATLTAFTIFVEQEERDDNHVDIGKSFVGWFQYELRLSILWEAKLGNEKLGFIHRPKLLFFFDCQLWGRQA